LKAVLSITVKQSQHEIFLYFVAILPSLHLIKILFVFGKKACLMTSSTLVYRAVWKLVFKTDTFKRLISSSAPV